MSKLSFTFCGVIFIILNSFGQSKGITPMHKIFQKYADSTIIVEYPTYGYDPPSYRIISKSNDTINAFTYNPLDTTYKKFVKWPTGMPKVLGLILSIQKTSFNSMPADVNIFFDIQKIDPLILRKIWLNISKIRPWQLLDDKNYPECSAVIMDAGYSIMHLITKKEIKTLIYYAPNYYEDQCPGNKNRQGINKINELFNKNYPKFRESYY